MFVWYYNDLWLTNICFLTGGEKMNVIMLLKHKDSLKYIYEDNTLRQGLEKMRAHSYTAIPVITRDGKYVGTVSEGDFLWHIIDKKTSGDIEEQEEFRIRDILRHDLIRRLKFR